MSKVQLFSRIVRRENLGGCQTRINLLWENLCCNTECPVTVWSGCQCDQLSPPRPLVPLDPAARLYAQER